MTTTQLLPDKVAQMTVETKEQKFDSLQKFVKRMNSAPTKEGVEKTPDGKALALTISHVEMTLDKIFFGLWSTENFQWSAIANEVQGSLELVVTHPVTGQQLRRIGAASIIIMVDKVPDSIKDNPQERNQWALSAANKKPNALDLAFPKLKAECLKNAALSLGKIFGRDLNRKNQADYVPFQIDKVEERGALLAYDRFKSAATLPELNALRQSCGPDVLAYVIDGKNIEQHILDKMGDLAPIAY